MRPTTGAMLQQNNNNNYPCLGMSDCPREMLQRCSRTSLPFPSRVELGLGDLPLIRGLRAWALCSRNRRKAGGLLGGGKPPTAPPLGGRGTSTSCPRPADVYLSGYGLPLGVDARQAGIGALVTVATLKTSEGGGKTQTQCLFLRTEKGSCLYSTAKPGSSSTSSTVGEWLRGKREGLGGGGGSAEPPPTEAAANRVRVRSGRRWRKSGIGRERGCKTPEGKQSERFDVPPETRTQKNSKDDREEAESPTRRTAIELDLDGKEAEELDSKNDSAVDEEKLSERLQERQNSPIPDSKAKQNEAEPQKEMEFNSAESSIPIGGAGPNAKEEIQLNSAESSIPIGGAGPNAKEEIQLNSAESSIPVGGAGPNAKEEIQLNSAESSIPIGGAGPNAKEEIQLNSAESSIPVGGAGPNAKEEIQLNSAESSITIGGAGPNAKEEIQLNSAESSIPVGGAGPNAKEEIQLNSAESSIPIGGAGPNAKEEIQLNSVESSVPVRGAEQNPEEETEQEVQFNSVESSIPVGGAGPNAKEEIQLNSVESSVPVRGAEQNPEEETEQEVQFNSVESSIPVGGAGPNAKEEIQFNSAESSIPVGGAGPNAKEEIQLNSAESSIPIGGAGPNAKEEIQLNSVESSVPVRGAEQNPEEETEQEVQFNSVESSIPVGGADQDVVRVFSNQNQRKVEHEEETNISSDEETREPRIFQKREENNNFQEEEVVFCSPVRQKNLSISEKSEKLKDECTCRKLQDEEENTSTLVFNASSNPAPSLASMATSGEEEEEEEEGSQKQSRSPSGELEEKAEEVRVSSTQEEEEDEFGVFMQAEGDPTWSDGVNMSASETSGSRARIAGGDDTWTAFPQEPTGESGGGVERWWPANAVEARRDGPPTNHSLVAVFAEAFPSLPGVSPGDPCDLEAVPTLTQLLRGRARQDQGLLDSFHDLNKMINQSHKRSSSASQNLLVQTLQLQPPLPESRSTSWSTNRRLSPGLSSANQHAAAKRRLSYDYNRNVVA